MLFSTSHAPCFCINRIALAHWLIGTSSACLVIDCGVREDFYGGDITDVPNNFYGAKFKVKCKPDFQLDGGTNHTDGEDVVECNADAHWMYGSIMCEGKSTSCSKM